MVGWPMEDSSDTTPLNHATSHRDSIHCHNILTVDTVSVTMKCMTRTAHADSPTTDVPTVEQREVVLHGRRVSYVQRGDLDSGGSPIVFLHGLASNATTWLDILDRLPADLVAIAIDLPGHGLSDRGSQD